MCMAMIRALPEDYANFTSMVLLLGTLNKVKLQDAFHAEEANCWCCAAPTIVSENDPMFFVAPGTNPKTCKCQRNPFCVFCKKPGPCIHICWTIGYFKGQRKDHWGSGPSGWSKNQQSMKKAKETATDTTTQLFDKDKPVVFAGRASLKPPAP